MKKIDMQFGVGFSMIIITIFAAILVISNSGVELSIELLILLSAIFALAVVLILKSLKKRKDLKNGIQIEDEFTNKATLYAGQKAYMTSMYLWFFIYLVNSLYPDFDKPIAVGILGSALIYAACLWYYKSTGKFDEK